MEFVIKESYINEIDVEKSRFIAYFFPVLVKEEFLNELNKIKKEHNKAKHHCYAYKINGEVKYSDDGEPQGTAGKPILSVIESKNLNNCAIVVVRYFGGTLLGSGRLLRTYSLNQTDFLQKFSAKLPKANEVKNEAQSIGGAINFTFEPNRKIPAKKI